MNNLATATDGVDSFVRIFKTKFVRGDLADVITISVELFEG